MIESFGLDDTNNWFERPSIHLRGTPRLSAARQSSPCFDARPTGTRPVSWQHLQQALPPRLMVAQPPDFHRDQFRVDHATPRCLGLGSSPHQSEGTRRPSDNPTPPSALVKTSRLLITVTFRFGRCRNGISRLNPARGLKIYVTHFAL
jgi:hypothetical protein